MYFNSSTALAMTLNKLGWVPLCVGTVSLYVYYTTCNFAVMPAKMLFSEMLKLRQTVLQKETAEIRVRNLHEAECTGSNVAPYVCQVGF